MSQSFFAAADLPRQFSLFFQDEGFQPFAHLLFRKLSEGNVCIHIDDLEREKQSLPESYQEALAAGRCSPYNARLVGGETDLRKPFILHNDRLYLQRYFRYETICVERIRRFAEEEETCLPERIEALQACKDLVEKLFGKAATGPDWQLTAALCAALQNFTIVTGGPGTGKTTTVAKLLALLFTLQPTLRVALAAPTGKAAARMAESLRTAPLPDEFEPLRDHFAALSPATIHRLLKAQRHSPYFHHDSGNPLPFDLIIADESSMIDVALFAKLLQAIGPGTRLILLGDKSQLASVEAGSMFGDLCGALSHTNRFCSRWHQLLNDLFPKNAAPLPEDAVCEAESHPLFRRIITLQVSHRFRDDAGIGRFSKAVIQNDEVALQQFLEENNDVQVCLDADHSKAVFESFISGYEAFIREPDIRTALQKLGKLRVLVVTRQGPYGLADTNSAIEAFLLGKGLLRPLRGHYENRPVILSKNYPDLGLFNGDTGIVRRDEKGILRVWFEGAGGELRAVLPGYLPDAQTAFAMTVHKSQGSEFNEVLVRLPDTEDMALLSRELLYTAVTRAREKVWIQGSGSVVRAAAARKIARASGIHERF